MTGRLEGLAGRVVDDPFFLAAVLADYARSEGLDDAGLAAALGCSVEALTRLRLCRRPDPQPGRFRREIERIAERFGADADALTEAVRRADALAALRAATAVESGLLMAARDREPTSNEPGQPDGW